MVTAFVLINIEDKNVKKLAETLLEFPGIKEVYPVAGEYDMVAVVRVGDNHALSELITEKIIHATGVLRTKTLFALQCYSKHDIAAFFKLK
jgi:DNA-binding Lrp family transcriptional regulator